MDLKEKMAWANKEFGTGGKSDWLTKFELGPTRVRLLSELEVLPQHYIEGGYKGICLGKDAGCPGCEAGDKPGIKWLGIVIHYIEDPETKELVGFIKPALLPHTVAQQIAMYQQNPDWAFEEAPMPYGITINKVSTGPEKQNVEYTVIPSPKMTEIPEDILKEYEKHNTPDQIKEAMKLKKAKELGLVTAESAPPAGDGYPDSINPEDIPF